MAGSDPTPARAQLLAAHVCFAAAALLLVAVAAGVLWASLGGRFVPPPAPPAPAGAGRPVGPPTPAARPVRLRPPGQARPLHDAIRDGYRAGRYRDEDVLGAIHALYHEFGTDEARALAADLERMIGAGEPR